MVSATKAFNKKIEKNSREVHTGEMSWDNMLETSLYKKRRMKRVIRKYKILLLECPICGGLID